MNTKPKHDHDIWDDLIILACKAGAVVLATVTTIAAAILLYGFVKHILIPVFLGV